MKRSPPAPDTKRLVKVSLDENTIGAASRDIEHERAIAIYDLIEENSFSPVGHDGGPYCLALQVVENRLVFDIRTESGDPVIAHYLSLSPFRRLVKDYVLVCESYYQAIRTATPSHIEAIDMGRRAVSKSTATLFFRRCCSSSEPSLWSARRLFTLLTVLHWKG